MVAIGIGMDGPSQPLGCGSTQIGGGVDGMIMGIDGSGQTLSLLGLPRTPKRKSMDGRMQCSNGKKVQDRLQVAMWQMKTEWPQSRLGARQVQVAM